MVRLLVVAALLVRGSASPAVKALLKPPLLSLPNFRRPRPEASMMLFSMEESPPDAVEFPPFAGASPLAGALAIRGQDSASNGQSGVAIAATETQEELPGSGVPLTLAPLAGVAAALLLWARKGPASSQIAAPQLEMSSALVPAVMYVDGAEPTPPQTATRWSRVGVWAKSVRPYLILVLLVIHKALCDGLASFTRGASNYNGGSVALVSEIIKYPILATAIAVYGGGTRRIGETLREVRTAPLNLWWIALCYAINNIIYYPTMSHLSPASYQIISQTKLLFTAGLMASFFKKRFTLRQFGALCALLLGSVLVQVSEMSVAVATGANVMLGSSLALLGALLAAIPNVFYERLLKREGENEWAKNVQITNGIMLWILGTEVARAFDPANPWGALLAHFTPATFFAGWTPWVWCICILKSLNTLLIPATLQYGDSILLNYAKPSAIVLLLGFSAVAGGVLPSISAVVGTVLVLASIRYY
jgi:UDP-sugar transporter A1/2/3